MPENHINNYFSEVDKYSENHLKDIDRFSRLLESLKGQKSNPEYKKHISSIEDTVKKIDHLVKKYSIKLYESEKADIENINHSDATPILKNRMLEDLYHRIKKKHEDSITNNPNKIKIENDIEKINKPGFFLTDWINLFLFAFHNGTITLLGHNIKDNSLKNITEKLLNSIKAVSPFLTNLLDEEYYIFSITEYNSLRLIIDLDSKVKEIEKIPWNFYYNASDLKKVVNSFSNVYFKIIENFTTIDNIIKKLGKKRKLPHGFYGEIRIILDSPLFNGRPIKYRNRNYFEKTIIGTLISYYTSLYKRLISSKEQIIYLLQIDIKIDTESKNLTEKAKLIENQKRNKQEEQSDSELVKYYTIKETLDRFIPQGENIAEKLLSEESISSGETWIRNYESSPMYKPVRLVEAFIKHFIDRINTPNSFVFRYDNSEFTHYFENRKEITAITKKINILDLEMTGANLKELLEFSGFDNSNTYQFISNIKNEKSKDNSKVISVFIHTAGSKCYTLAERLRNEIEHYEKNREIDFKIQDQNYNFYQSAELAARKQLKLHKILGHEPLTVEDILIAICSLSYYIAYLLQSDALMELISFKETLEADNSFQIQHPEIFQKYSSNTIEDENNTIEDENNTIEESSSLKPHAAAAYTDNLTGLFIYDYFKNIIHAEQYNSRDQYVKNETRHVFFLEVENFQEINKTMGHESGDYILKKVASILLKNLPNPQKDFLLRFKNAQIIGFIHRKNIKDVIQYLTESGLSINKISRSSNGRFLQQTFIMSGVVEECELTNLHYTFDIAKRLMHSGKERNKNSITFLKNSNIRIKRKNITSDGSIDKQLLYILLDNSQL